MSRKLMNPCIIFVLMLAALATPDRGVQAQEPLPGINVNVTGDWIEVWGLDTDEIPARLEVLRGEGSELVCSGDYPVIDGNPWLDCPDSGIQAGDLVTLQINNVLVNEHIVPIFTIDVFVQENSYFKGKGPVGEIVRINVCNPDQACIQGLSTVDQEGFWEYTFVDVSVTPYHFWATVWDGVNSTQANYIPPPIIEVNHTTDWLSAWGFASEDQFARLEVLSPTSDLKCSDDFDLDGSWDISLDCQMQDANILPGDLVVLEVDGQQVNELLIQPIFISEYNPMMGFIRGTAPETAYVQADICNQDGFCISGEAAKLGGEVWEMFFDPAPFNYVGWVAAHVIEPDGDHTIAEYFHPVMDVNVIGDWISAWGFGPDDQFARLEVWRGPDLICEGDFDLSEGDSWLECWQQDMDILPGDQVLLIVDGAQVKDHTVFDLTLDEVNTDEGYFAGTAPMETTVRVDVCNPPDWECMSQEYTTWSGFTSWEISFGPDVVDPDAWYAAFITDEDGDQTMAELLPPQEPPVMLVNVSGDWISAWGFGPEAQFARLEVWRGEGPDLMCEADFDLSEGDPWLECWQQGVNILPNDQVLLFVDGDLIKEHIVYYLTLDTVDFDLRRFAGEADSGSVVKLVICDVEYNCLSEFSSPVTGSSWDVTFVDFPFFVDWFAAYIADEDGDQTQADFFFPPQPLFTINPDQGWVGSGGWPVGLPIELMITDPVEGIILQETQVSDDDEWNPGIGMVWFDLDLSSEDLHPGVFVSLSDGDTTKVTEIVPLSFDSIDPDGNAAGIGPAGGFGHVCLDHETECQEIEVSPDGEWIATFDWYTPDMTELYDAHVVIWDEDGDETMANLPVEEAPQPFFNVNLTEEIIFALGWPYGEAINLEVFDLSSPDPILSVSGVVDGYTSYDPDLTQLDFVVAGYDIQPGYLVRISNSTQAKEHFVTGLVIDEVNYDEFRITGSTGPVSNVGIAGIGLIPEFYPVLSETSGVWSVTFSQDLTNFFIIIISEGDNDGDSTEWVVYPNLPPVTNDDFYSTDEDTSLHALSIGVLSNDSDPENSSLTAILANEAEHGILVLNPDGSFNYTPDPDFFGSDSFSYYASDGERISNEAVVTLTINPVNDVPQVSLDSEFMISEGQSFFGSGSFSDPDQDSWTGTVDYFSDGVDIQPLTLNVEKGFDLSYSYPADDGEYTVTVNISDDLEVGTAHATVMILNVSPTVVINSLGNGDDFTLVGLGVNLVSTFFDPGADTHSAVIDWDDGSEIIDPATSTMTADHVFHSPGVYVVSVTVTDDDGGSGSASASLEVIDPVQASQRAIDELDLILENPNYGPEVIAAIENALVDLEGAHDGLSSSGALDKIEGGQWNAALVKIEKAFQDLEEAEAADPGLDLSALFELLRLISEAVALE